MIPLGIGVMLLFAFYMVMAGWLAFGLLLRKRDEPGPSAIPGKGP